MSDTISRQAAIDMLKNRWKKTRNYEGIGDDIAEECELYLKQVPSAQPDVPDTNVGDCISRQAVVKFFNDWISCLDENCHHQSVADMIIIKNDFKNLPSAQPEQRYTEEELRVFQHGISLSLLSKRSSQHWQYDEDTATEIKFLERLYEKVVADMRGEQDG